MINTLSTLLCNSLEGIVILNREGNVVSLTKGAKVLIGDSFQLPKDIYVDEMMSKRVYFYVNNKSVLVTASPLIVENNCVGLICILQDVKALRKVLSTPLEDRKRTFTVLRERLLVVLNQKRKTINQIANDSGINWKTVEKHLTYFVGKGLVEEVFSSEYVRIFELTQKGKELAKTIEEREMRKIVKENFINPESELIKEVCNEKV